MMGCMDMQRQCDPILSVCERDPNFWDMILHLEKLTLRHQNEQTWECFLLILREAVEEAMYQLLFKRQMESGL